MLRAVAYLGFGKGGAWRARRARAYNGVWGWSPQGGPGAEPLVVGSEGFPGRGSLWHYYIMTLAYGAWFLGFSYWWVLITSPQNIVGLYGLQLVFKSARRHWRVISDATSHGDFNRILYRYEIRPSNIVEFCSSCWKMAKTHLLI